MKTVVKALLLSCVVAILSGCGVTGKWTLQSIKPESEKARFNLQCMCLMSDGSYMAAAQEEGKSECLKGTYTYDAKTKLLTFKTDGKERAYHAQLMCPGTTLKVTPAEAGETWTATMKHSACSKDKYCCCGQACGGKMCNPKQCPQAKGGAAPCQVQKAEKPAEKKPAEAKPGEKK
jgi:hypothetical protein